MIDEGTSSCCFAKNISREKIAGHILDECEGLGRTEGIIANHKSFDLYLLTDPSQPHDLILKGFEHFSMDSARQGLGKPSMI